MTLFPQKTFIAVQGVGGMAPITRLMRH